MIYYTFLKSRYHNVFKFQKYMQNFQKQNFYLSKAETVQILFKGICAKIYAKFLYNNCTNCFLLLNAFKGAIKCRNPTTGFS